MKSLYFVLLLLLFPSMLLAQGVIIHEPGDHFHLPRPRPRPTPADFSYRIKELIIDSSIRQQIASTQVTQVFENTGNQTIQATFVFPLPYDGAVDKMTFLVDGKELEGKLLPKDKAREIYEGYIRRNQDPALLEWIGTGMFQSSVFPIPPGATRTVTLRYSQLLKKDGTLVDYLFPLSTAKYTAKPLDKFSMRVAISSEQEIKNIYSPTHDIQINRDDAKNAVVLHSSTQTLPLSDFRLVFDEMPGEIGASLMSYWPECEDQGYFVLLASPTIKSGDRPPVAKTVVFVIDQSGSMSGDKIEQARNAAKFVLNNLRPGDMFNIIRYESTVSSFAPELQRFDDDSRGKALGFINGISAGGSTNIDEALKTALGMLQEPQRPSYVVFLTDGLPTVGETNELKIAQSAKAANAMGARLISFGVGYDVNSRLLDRLTRENHGQSEYVRPNEDIEAAVAKLYRKISDPVLSDMQVSIHVEDQTDADGEVTNRMYPAGVTDLFANSQLMLVGRYRKSGATSVTISGNVGESKQDFGFKLQLAAKGQESVYPFVQQLWAIRRIGEIIDLLDLNGKNQELIDELVALSTRHGIVTPYTSYLADENAGRGQLADRAGNRYFAGEALSSLESASGGDVFYERSAKQSLRLADNLSQGNAQAGRAAPMAGAITGRGGRIDNAAGVTEESPLPEGLMKFGNATVYRKQNLLVADNAVDVNVETDKDIIRIKKFSDEYFSLVKDNSADENQYLASQGDEELLIVLRGKKYLIQ